MMILNNLSDDNVRLDKISRLLIHELECILDLVESLELPVKELTGMDTVIPDHTYESLDTTCTTRAEAALDGYVGHSKTPKMCRE